MTSPCDACKIPGKCCRVVRLNGGTFPSPRAETVEAAQAEIDEWNAAEADGTHDGRPPYNGWLPFRPLYRDQNGDWSCWCPNLDLETGRCRDYANRPYACSSYEPGCDSSCVFGQKDASTWWT